MTLDVALRDFARGAATTFEPPSRLTVAESAAAHFFITRPGGGAGPWSPLETPYMVEPMNTLASRLHSAVCFVGPAQTGKTAALGEGWVAHAVVSDPGDMAIFQMTQDKAREYSKQRVDRLIRNSPALRSRIRGSQDDNTHDKLFTSGMWLRIAWPTATNMASTSYRYVFGTDYDRWPEDIDGEGDGFGLMGKRTTTFLSRGMTCVESSPGFDYEAPVFDALPGHQAPPVKGVCDIYNRSDRRRWYWTCPHCRERFEAAPGLSLFRLPTDDELLEGIRALDIDTFARQHARVVCPRCDVDIPASVKGTLNKSGLWLPEGYDTGEPRTSSIAGFYLGGVAAAYVSWEALIRKHLQALLAYSLTGDERPLKTTVNVDQALPYMPRHLVEASRMSGGPASRADPEMPRFIVPEWARFVLAAVDVQGGGSARFVVQVHAFGEGAEQRVVDRFAITRSERDGAPVDPASQQADWQLLTDRVIKATYRTNTEGREVRVHAVIVDSGGEAGATARAYAWWRGLRDQGLSHKVYLAKGYDGLVDSLYRLTWVGNQHGKGDVPLHLLASNVLKDMVIAGLRRVDIGPGYYHFPAESAAGGWAPQGFFAELEAEVRMPNGKYKQVKARNETLDLCYYLRGLYSILGCDRRGFWQSPPPWALPITEDANPNVTTAEARRREKAEPPAPVERVMRRSQYMQGR